METCFPVFNQIKKNCNFNTGFHRFTSLTTISCMNWDSVSCKKIQLINYKLIIREKKITCYNYLKLVRIESTIGSCQFYLSLLWYPISFCNICCSLFNLQIFTILCSSLSITNSLSIITNQSQIGFCNNSLMPSQINFRKTFFS